MTRCVGMIGTCPAFCVMSTYGDIFIYMPACGVLHIRLTAVEDGVWHIAMTMVSVVLGAMRQVRALGHWLPVSW